LTGDTAINPGKRTERPVRRVQDKTGANVIIYPIKLQRSIYLTVGGLPNRAAIEYAIVSAAAVISDAALCLIKSPVRDEFGRKDLLKQMLRKGRQVLCIYYAVS
jgi:hypothetical protein